MSLIVFVMPVLAQQDDLMAGRIAGELAARARVNRQLWFAGGCFGGLLVVIFAHVYEPTPPAIDLLGKSPEYAAAYTDAYRTTSKNIQSNRALTGCVIGVLAEVALYAMLIAASASTY